MTMSTTLHIECVDYHIFSRTCAFLFCFLIQNTNKVYHNWIKNQENAPTSRGVWGGLGVSRPNNTKDNPRTIKWTTKCPTTHMRWAFPTPCHVHVVLPPEYTSSAPHSIEALEQCLGWKTLILAYLTTLSQVVSMNMARLSPTRF